MAYEEVSIFLLLIELIKNFSKLDNGQFMFQKKCPRQRLGL